MDHFSFSPAKGQKCINCKKSCIKVLFRSNTIKKSGSPKDLKTSPKKCLLPPTSTVSKYIFANENKKQREILKYINT